MRCLPWGAVALLVAAGAAWAQDTQIGEATAVVRLVRAQIGDRDRRLNVADNVFANENINTGEDSASQLKFLDDTVLTVGPSSTVVLDRFVYDPGAANQEVVVNASVGVLRFVTGRLNRTAYRIRTPTATIGIRGTVFTAIIDEAGETELIVEDGEITATNESLPGSPSVTVTAGLATTVTPDQPPTPPAPPTVPAQTQVATMDTMIAVSGGAGGASSPASQGRLMEVRDEALELRETHRCGC